MGARHDMAWFHEVQASTQNCDTLAQAAEPDLSLWGSERIRAWCAALTQPAVPPLAILRIPKITLEVAVLPGTSDFVLNRAVGHIEDTALPGGEGNSGIAGHRVGSCVGYVAVAWWFSFSSARGRDAAVAICVLMTQLSAVR